MAKPNINASDFIDGDGIVHQCCKCKKFNNLQSNKYEDLDEWQKPPECIVSHGYCPPCGELAMAELRDYHADTR